MQSPTGRSRFDAGIRSRGNTQEQQRHNVRRILRRCLTLLLVIFAITTRPSLNAWSDIGHRWTSNTVLYYVNPQSIYVSQNAALSALQLAANAWNEQSGGSVSLVYVGTTTGSSLTLNYKNEVLFRDSSNGGYVAETYYWSDRAGRLIDADIVFWEGAFQFFAGSGCVNGIYIENVAIHEFGHALGLGHSDVPGATMAPAMSSYCDRTQLTLEVDDVAGIESLYPPSPFTPEPSAPVSLSAAQNRSSPYNNSGSSTYSTIASAQPAAPTVTNTAPSVTLKNPTNDSSYPEGAPISFSAIATDNQDGNLSGNLRWTSNLMGDIGNGASFARTLTVGTHTITASVIDSDGMMGSRQVSMTVTVAAPAPSITTITRHDAGEQDRTPRPVRFWP